MQSLYEYTKIRENIWQIAEDDGYSVPLSGEARWQCFWIPDTETAICGNLWRKAFPPLSGDKQPRPSGPYWGKPLV